MLALALALAAAAPPAASPRGISYETGPCFGACPVYRVTVNADGTGLFEGRRFTAVTGARRFRLTAAQYRAFAARLAPLRPARGSVRYATGPLCGPVITDLPSVEVTWSGARGGPQSLYYYYGCDPRRHRDMAARLRAAPGLLPIGDYISPRR